MCVYNFCFCTDTHTTYITGQRSVTFSAGIQKNQDEGNCFDSSDREKSIKFERVRLLTDTETFILYTASQQMQ